MSAQSVATLPTGQSVCLTKDQAVKIAELTSSIFPQGSTWVLQEWDLDAGVDRLTRGLSKQRAHQKLRKRRSERVEELLRSYEDAPAFTIRKWAANPFWTEGGVWEWATKRWYTTTAEAELACESLQEEEPGEYQIHQIETRELAGHFRVDLD